MVEIGWEKSAMRIHDAHVVEPVRPRHCALDPLWLVSGKTPERCGVTVVNITSWHLLLYVASLII